MKLRVLVISEEGPIRRRNVAGEASAANVGADAACRCSVPVLTLPRLLCLRTRVVKMMYCHSREPTRRSLSVEV